MKKILQILALLPRLVGNIHKVNDAVEKGYSAWQGVYGFLSHLTPGPAQPGPASPGLDELPADELPTDEPAAPAQVVVAL